MMTFLDLVWSVKLFQRDLPNSRRNVSSKAEVRKEWTNTEPDGPREFGSGSIAVQLFTTTDVLIS